MSSTRFAFPKAPVTDPGWASAALLLCAHGIGGGPGIATRHAEAIARRRLFQVVRPCCLSGRPGPAEALRGLKSKRRYLVPFLMAEGYTTGEVLPRALAGIDTSNLFVSGPVGTHPGLATVIHAMALELCAARQWPAWESVLLLVGHGTWRNANSRRTAEWHADALAAAGCGFAEVTTAFLDDEPGVPQALRRLRARHCVVVGLFADRGPHGADDVARLLAPAGAKAAYAGPVGAHPGVVELVLDLVGECERIETAA